MHSVESWRMFTLNINYFLPVTFVPLGRCCRASWLKELFLSQEHRNFDEYFLNAAKLCIGLEMYIADLLETWHCLLIKTGLLRFIFYFILFLSFMYIWSWKQEFFFPFHCEKIDTCMKAERKPEWTKTQLQQFSTPRHFCFIYPCSICHRLDAPFLLNQSTVDGLLGCFLSFAEGNK